MKSQHGYKTSIYWTMAINSRKIYREPEVLYMAHYHFFMGGFLSWSRELLSLEKLIALNYWYLSLWVVGIACLSFASFHAKGPLKLQLRNNNVFSLESSHLSASSCGELLSFRVWRLSSVVWGRGQWAVRYIYTCFYRKQDGRTVMILGFLP